MLLTILTGFALTSAAVAQTTVAKFFVDGNFGNDTNSGLTSTSAVQTVARCSKLCTASGKPCACLLKQAYYNEFLVNLTLANKNMTLVAYPGNVISSKDVNAEWTLTSSCGCANSTYRTLGGTKGSDLLPIGLLDPIYPSAPWPADEVTGVQPNRILSWLPPSYPNTQGFQVWVMPLPNTLPTSPDDDHNCDDGDDKDNWDRRRLTGATWYMACSTTVTCNFCVPTIPFDNSGGGHFKWRVDTLLPSATIVGPEWTFYVRQTVQYTVSANADTWIDNTATNYEQWGSLQLVGWTRAGTKWAFVQFDTTPDASFGLANCQLQATSVQLRLVPIYLVVPDLTVFSTKKNKDLDWSGINGLNKNNYPDCGGNWKPTEMVCGGNQKICTQNGPFYPSAAVCRNADGTAWGLDCTTQNGFIPGSPGAWGGQTPCVVLAATNGQTCNQWCASKNAVCVKGQANSAVSTSTCTLASGPVNGTGCDVRMQTQICGCQPLASQDFVADITPDFIGGESADGDGNMALGNVTFALASENTPVTRFYSAEASYPPYRPRLSITARTTSCQAPASSPSVCPAKTGTGLLDYYCGTPRPTVAASTTRAASTAATTRATTAGTTAATTRTSGTTGGTTAATSVAGTTAATTAATTRTSATAGATATATTAATTSATTRATTAATTAVTSQTSTSSTLSVSWTSATQSTETTVTSASTSTLSSSPPPTWKSCTCVGNWTPPVVARADVNASPAYTQCTYNASVRCPYPYENVMCKGEQCCPSGNGGPGPTCPSSVFLQAPGCNLKTFDCTAPTPANYTCLVNQTVFCPGTNMPCKGNSGCPDGTTCPSATTLTVPGFAKKRYDCNQVLGAGYTCAINEYVPCPNSTVSCYGNQCCPDGSTCPSAPLNPAPGCKNKTAQCQSLNWGVNFKLAGANYAGLNLSESNELCAIAAGVCTTIIELIQTGAVFIAKPGSVVFDGSLAPPLGQPQASFDASVSSFLTNPSAASTLADLLGDTPSVKRITTGIVTVENLNGKIASSTESTTPLTTGTQAVSTSGSAASGSTVGAATTSTTPKPTNMQSGAGKTSWAMGSIAATGAAALLWW